MSLHFKLSEAGLEIPDVGGGIAYAIDYDATREKWVALAHGANGQMCGLNARTKESALLALGMLIGQGRNVFMWADRGWRDQQRLAA